MPARKKKQDAPKDNKQKDQSKRRLKVKRLNYTEEDLSKALTAVKKGASIRATSLRYNVPFSTIRGKNKGLYPAKISKPGPSPILSNEEEDELGRWIRSMSSRGFLLTKEMVIESAVHMLKTKPRDNPFKDGKPGRHWYECFMRRHPELSLKELNASEPCRLRAEISKKNLQIWFKTTEEYLRSKNLLDVDASRIFSYDEFGFMLSPQGNKNVMTKRNRDAYHFVENYNQDCLTALLAGNAAGQMAPPMVIFSYERMPTAISKRIPLEFSTGCSENGWMTRKNFYEYMTNVFYPWCLIQGIEFPVIFYMDCCSSYTTYALSDFCAKHKIEILSSYSSSVQMTQPMDIAYLRPLKTVWKQLVESWRLTNDGALMLKRDFATVLKSALDLIGVKNTLVKGFADCGLFPFCPEKFDYSYIMSSSSVDKLKSGKSCLENLKNEYAKKCVLNLIEKFLDRKILDEFKVAAATNDRTWHGEIQYLKLFLFWLECQEPCELRDDDEDSDESVPMILEKRQKSSKPLYKEDLDEHELEEDVDMISSSFSSTIANAMMEEVSDLSESNNLNSSRDELLFESDPCGTFNIHNINPDSILSGEDFIDVEDF